MVPYPGYELEEAVAGQRETLVTLVQNEQALQGFFWVHDVAQGYAVTYLAVCTATINELLAMADRCRHIRETIQNPGGCLPPVTVGVQPTPPSPEEPS